MKRLLLILALLPGVSWAFIPPISEKLVEIFGNRKSSEVVELQFRHLVQVKEGEFVEVIEQFLGTRAGGLIQWQMAGQPPVYSDWTTKEYQFRDGRTLPSRTGAFIDYFLVDGGTEYLDRLMRERFLRRDQLLQYKPGYKPEGDPKTWDTKGNYLLHDDIDLQKVGKEFGIAVNGMTEGDQKRTVYFSRDGKGVLRLEWGVGAENAAWDFTGFTSFGPLGRLPRFSTLQINGMERVKSTLSQARAVKRDTLATARTASKQPSASSPPSSALEEAIRLIVRYR